MIENLYRLGKALESDQKLANYFAPWQNPFPAGDIEKLKVIYFPIESGIVGSYLIEPFKTAMLKEYLYRQPSGGNGAPLVPTTFFYPADGEDKHLEKLARMMGRLSRALRSNLRFYFTNENEYQVGIEKIQEQLASFDGNRKDRYLLTIKLNGKWLGEYDENIQIFRDEAYGKYYEKTPRYPESRGYNRLCSITYQEGEVWGRVDTLGFTVNDPTFSRGGFDEAFSYRMFPVSPDAVRLLEGAKEYAMEKLRRRYSSSLEYIILPHFLQESNQLLKYVTGKIIKEDNEKSIDDFSKAIFHNEEVIYTLSERDEKLKEGVFYDILFFHKDKAQLTLKLHLTDLLPSRFSAIFKTKQLVENRYKAINRLENSKGEVTEFFITFYKIQRYFSRKIKKETIFHPFFFKLMEAVFYGQQIDEMAVLQGFQKQIQEDFKQRNEPSLRYRYMIATKEAFALWHFFAVLGLFTNKQYIDMDGTPSPRNYDDFVAAHLDFFDNPYKKAAFNMGCLVSVLTTAQYQKLKSEPFLERLNSLSLDEPELRKLFPVLIDKMRQYEDIDRYQFPYVQKLKTAVVEALMNPTELDRASISFAFTAGMVMQKEFNKGKPKSSGNAAEETADSLEGNELSTI